MGHNERLGFWQRVKLLGFTSPGCNWSGRLVLTWTNYIRGKSPRGLMHSHCIRKTKIPAMTFKEDVGQSHSSMVPISQ